MLYDLYELQHAALLPLRLWAGATQAALQNPANPAANTSLGRAVAAGAELIERTTRRFGKPEFGIRSVQVDGQDVAITEVAVLEKPFCTLLNFRRAAERKDPKVLLVAPVSGHYATLLRGTAAALAAEHDVYITDWADAKTVPLSVGAFDLDDYIAYLMEFLSFLGPDTHVVAVCQPSVPVLAAISLMAQGKDANQPRSMTLMGGPIDTRAAPTAVTKLAEQHDISWFRRNVIATVPGMYPGAGRQVYPGFIQLTGFMTMNLDRHIEAHAKLFEHLVTGDGESAAAHRRFYDEYLSVMDLTAEFYLQTVETVFQKHHLPKGEMMWRGIKVDPAAIRKTGLLTVEGELDDISAPGQTVAAHELCRNIPPAKHAQHLQTGVGHYGIFNGRKWREEIMPKVRAFIRANQG